MATVGTSLRDRQIAAVLQMLNLNEPLTVTGSKKDPKEPIWKILIYDRVGMDVLTPLFTVHELRQHGITLHIPLHSLDRTSPIPDVPSIYFALPSEDNVDRIARDIQTNLYGNYYLNFTRPIPRSQMEDIATAVLRSNDYKCVSKVYDQYLDFVCLENDLFVLNSNTGSASDQDFYALNRPNVTDTEMTTMIDNIVDSLFSVLVTYGQVPIIRTPKGNAAEIIGEKLDKKIRENLRDPRASLFQTSHATSSEGYSPNNRPMLVVFDRMMDLATPLAHAWTYQSLTHDVIENIQNQIVFSEDDSKKRTYTVDTRRDNFWKQHRGSPFPIVAEAIQNELEDYRRSEDEVKKLKQNMGMVQEEQNIDMNTAKLTNAIRDLPQLLERKRQLDNHTSIATALLNEIKSRHLDLYNELESKLLTRSDESVSINSVLLDLKMGSFEDKMRLYLIYYLVNHSRVSNSELEQFLESLASVAPGEKEQELLKAVQFIKKWISYSKMGGESMDSFQQPLSHSKGSSSMLTKLVNTGSSFLMEGVRNLVFKRQDLPLTRMTFDLMEGRGDQEKYRYFDPKQLKPNSTQRASPSNECIVFVVGGGNYIEYQNLMDSFNQKKKVIYGATCLYNGEQFLQQLAKLGATE